jgi:hypothetical protein
MLTRTEKLLLGNFAKLQDDPTLLNLDTHAMKMLIKLSQTILNGYMRVLLVPFDDFHLCRSRVMYLFYLIKNNLTVVVKMSHATTNIGRTLGMVVGYFLIFFIHLLNFTVRYQDMKIKPCFYIGSQTTIFIN